MSKVVSINGARKRLRQEDALQISVAQYLDLFLPDDYRWFHVPNEGNRNINYAAKMKRFGLKPNVPDCVIVGNGGHCWMIELKADGYMDGTRRRGRGYPSKEQTNFHNILRGIGIPVEVCRSIDEVKDCLWSWGIIEQGNNSEVRDR